MPKTKAADLDDLGAQFREAQEAVTLHRKREVDADLERMAWLRRHRGIPSDALYDRKTGDPIHPELAELEDALAKASADTRWCEALVLACGEAFKGEPLGKVLARNEKHRHKITGRAAQLTDEDG